MTRFKLSFDIKNTTLNEFQSFEILQFEGFEEVRIGVLKSLRGQDLISDLREGYFAINRLNDVLYFLSEKLATRDSKLWKGNYTPSRIRQIVAAELPKLCAWDTLIAEISNLKKLSILDKKEAVDFIIWNNDLPKNLARFLRHIEDCDCCLKYEQEEV